MYRNISIALTLLAMLAVACGDASTPEAPPVPPSPAAPRTTMAAPATTMAPPVTEAPAVPEAPSPTSEATPAEPGALAWETLDAAGPLPARAASAGPNGFAGVDLRWEDEPGPTSVLLVSGNGLAWEAVEELASTEVNELIAGGAGYVAVGARHLDPGDLYDLRLEPWIAWSEDGRTWTEATFGPAIGTAHGTGLAQPLGLAPPGGIVAMPATADGPAIEGTEIIDVIATGDGLAALGRAHGPDRVNILWASADGMHWEEATATGFADGAPVHDLAGSDGRYVALGRVPVDCDCPGPLRAWWSDDGLNWTEADGAPSFQDEFGAGPLLSGVVATDGGFVLAGNSWDGPARTWTSPDGRAWRDGQLLPGAAGRQIFVQSVAAGGDRIVVLGDEPTEDGWRPVAWVRADGIWEQADPPGTGDANVFADLVAYMGGHWLVLGRANSGTDLETRVVGWVGRLSVEALAGSAGP